MNNLGDRIKGLREKRKFTQKDLSDKTGLSVVQISRYENNERKPDPEALNFLVDALETSGDYMLGRTNDPSPSLSTTSATILTERNKRDIAKHLEEIKRKVASGDGLIFDGEPLSPEAQASFLDALEYVLNATKIINKKTTPKKKG